MRNGSNARSYIFICVSPRRYIDNEQEYEYGVLFNWRLLAFYDTVW